MKTPSFLPWIGENYKKEGFAGRRILVLGESHYCANAEDANEGITIEVIRAVIDKAAEFEPYMNTFTKFAKALLGRAELTHEDKVLLWNSIAFYNYIQVPMPATRVAPSREDFAASSEPFFETLEALRPEIMIVWGSRLYNNLPKGGMQGDDLKAPDGRWIETWRYFLKDGFPVRVIPITHPSAAFSPDYWHEVISIVL